MVRSVAITLLRHGITQENIEKKYLGWTDVPLHRDALKSLELLKSEYERPELLLTSDLLRCKQTADILYPYFPRNEMKELRECHFGKWECKTYEELKDVKSYRAWLNNIEKEKPLAGEEFSIFKTRVLRGWNKMIDLLEVKSVKRVMIVSHGGPIRILLEQFAPVEKPFWDWRIGYGEGFTLDTTIDRLRGMERCISLQEVPVKERESG